MSETNHSDLMCEFVHELTEHQAALRAFVCYLLGGRADGAVDLVQEVNLLLWKKHKQYRPGTNFRAWAFTTARYVVLGHRRRLRKDGYLMFDSDLIERLGDEWQAEPNESERKMAALESCFEQLPGRDKKLLRARYNGHGGVEQMAGEGELTAGNLRSRLFRLRAALKQCVQHELKAEEGLI